jgi:hypothetical protein
MIFELTEGWTGPIDVQLKADGSAVVLTGCTVALILKANDDSVVDTTDDVTLYTALSGIVRYVPDAADLVAAKGPYRARWKVTDQTSRITFFPNGAPDTWNVWPQ